MGERGEIAAGTDRTLLWDVWVDIGVEQADQPLQQQRADTGVALAERVGAEQDRGAHDIFGERIAHPGRVALDELALQFFYLIGGDHHIAQLPEAGGEAVDLVAAAQQPLDEGAAAVDAGAGAVPEDHATAAAGDLDDLLNGEILAVEGERRGSPEIGEFVAGGRTGGVRRERVLVHRAAPVRLSRSKAMPTPERTAGGRERPVVAAIRVARVSSR